MQLWLSQFADIVEASQLALSRAAGRHSSTQPNSASHSSVRARYRLQGTPKGRKGCAQAVKNWSRTGRTSIQSSSRHPSASGSALLQSAACQLHCAGNHLLSSGRLPFTLQSPVVQVCVLNPDLLTAWHLVAGHQRCVTLQVLPSRVIVIVHLAAQTSLALAGELCSTGVQVQTSAWASC